MSCVNSKCVATLVGALFALANWTHAADEPRTSERSIRVVGSGQVLVTPDHVRVSLGISNFDADLMTAKKATDERARRIIALARQMSVDEKDIQTDRVEVAIRYEEKPTSSYSTIRDYSKIIGYSTSTSIVVTLRDLSKLESLIIEALKAGANQLNDVEFRTSKLREYRDEARRMASRAARDKATLLAGELGAHVGRPMKIEEWVHADGGNSLYQMQNDVGSAPAAPLEVDQAVAPGQIAVTAQVDVTFELQ